MIHKAIAVLTAVALSAACSADESGEMSRAEAMGPDSARAVSTLGVGGPEPTAEEIARGRGDPSWRAVVQFDPVGLSSSERSSERWGDISAAGANRGPMYLPLGDDVTGNSVVRVQTLLDRALFAPGVIDGRWGKNVEKAVYWLQKREGLRATGQMDSTTFSRLVQLAGTPQEIVREHRLSDADVEGPFVEIPDEIYEANELDCTCYESLSEKLGERFHSTPELLARLNPGVDLDGLEAGDRLLVPAIREEDARARADARVAEIVVSVAGNYLHAKDASGRIVYHFPTTLGSGYSPEEGAEITVTSVTPNPWWHLQPRLLHVGDPNRPDVKIPPGPNNAVGNMWIDLSKEHYGIHGTARPETIGYATSSGCVRLTNWDANFLGEQVESGIPVRFEDIPPGRSEQESHGA